MGVLLYDVNARLAKTSGRGSQNKGAEIFIRRPETRAYTKSVAFSGTGTPHLTAEFHS